MELKHRIFTERIKQKMLEINTLVKELFGEDGYLAMFSHGDGHYSFNTLDDNIQMKIYFSLMDDGDIAEVIDGEYKFFGPEAQKERENLIYAWNRQETILDGLKELGEDTTETLNKITAIKVALEKIEGGK